MAETQRTRELGAILDLVRNGKASTRGEIVDLLNLRSTSVSEYVGILVEKDVLRESVPKQRGRGRPTAFLSYNGQRFGAIFLQVASRSIIAKSVDMAGRVVAEAQSSPPPETGNAEMAQILLSLAREVQAAFPAGVEPTAVVCSLSGLLDAPQRLWCFSSRWPDLRNLDLAEALRPLGNEVVVIRNLDAELAGRLAEAPSEKETGSVLLLHWGYGIGASYHTDGHIVNRSRGRFCEIGHWALGNGRGALCTCGNKDCLETVAALWSLEPRLREAFPELSLDEDAFGSSARRLELFSVPGMDEAVQQMVRLTGNLCRLLFPDTIILTGPFVQNLEIFNRFVAGLELAPLLKNLDRISVTSGQPRQRHEMVGALQGVFERARADLLGEG